MAVVLDFDRGVDAAGGDEVDRGAVGFGGHDLDGLGRFQDVDELDRFTKWIVPQSPQG